MDTTILQELHAREVAYTKFDYSPDVDSSKVFPNTYYVANIDALERRFYARSFSTAPLANEQVVAGPRAASAVWFPIPRTTNGLARNAPVLLRGMRLLRR